MENKKNNKGLIIALVVIVLLLGCLGFGYYLYSNMQKDNNDLKKELTEIKKDMETSKKSTEVNTTEKESVVENTKYVYSLKDVKCQTNIGKCDKTVTVSYNGESHKITVVSLSTGKYDIYIDDQKVDSGLRGYEYDDFDGNIYIFNNKYVGILRAVHVGDAGSKGYRLTLYSNGVRVGNDESIVYQGQTLCRDSECKQILNELENIEFDGTSLKYWDQSCEYKSNVRYSLTFDGSSITKAIIEKTGNMYGGGASAC